MVTYVIGCYRPNLQSANISYLTQLELFFNIRCVCTIQNRNWMEQDFTQFAVLILCDDFTVCDEMDAYFATEADTMIAIVCEVDFNKDF